MSAYQLSRTQSSLTVAQPAALLSRTYSVPDIRHRAGFNFSPRYPLNHYINYPYKYYSDYSYGRTMDFKPSLLHSYYYHRPSYFNHPWYYYRTNYLNYKYDYDPYRKWTNPYYGSRFNYWSPYRSHHYSYHLL